MNLIFNYCIHLGVVYKHGPKLLSEKIGEKQRKDGSFAGFYLNTNPSLIYPTLQDLGK